MIRLKTISEFIKSRWPWLILLVLIVPAIAAYIILWQIEDAQKIRSTGIIGVSGGKDITKSLNVPHDKYPNGFPIEVLDKRTYKKDDRYIITGFCRWHPEADPVMGGKVAVVPVVLYEMKFETKELIPVVQTFSRREDGFFALPIRQILVSTLLV